MRAVFFVSLVLIMFGAARWADRRYPSPDATAYTRGYTAAVDSVRAVAPDTLIGLALPETLQVPLEDVLYIGKVSIIARVRGPRTVRLTESH